MTDLARFRRPAGWQLLLALGCLVVVVYFWLAHLGSDWAGLQVALYGSANGTVVVTALWAAWRHRGLRGPMLLIAGSALASVSGDVIFYCLALVGGEVAYPSVADVLYLAGYALLALACCSSCGGATPAGTWPAASTRRPSRSAPPT